LASSVNIARIMKTIADVRQGTGAPPRLCVVGAPAELRRVVGVLSAGAADELAGVSDVIDALAPADFPTDPRHLQRWDIVVVVAAGSTPQELLPATRAVRRARADLVVLAEGMPGEVDPEAFEAGAQADEIARDLGRDASASPTLENRIIHALGDRAAALAARLPSLRRPFADHVVITNAAQNAVIGAVVIIPGADMPAMTINQVRMVLKIAAAYGEELGLDRALEILSVVGTGFVFRALARQALDFVPGFGWALKGAVGFSGTVAIGQAAIAYFEAGAPLRSSRFQKVSNALDKARARLPGPVAKALEGRR
jgi:uncharacterized protein (DUF697 family)